MSDRDVLVYVDLPAGPVRAGTLHARVRQGRESASFEYHSGWLAHRDRFALDPEYLPLGKGPFHTALHQRLFPGLTDSAPDRWGRRLMARQARLEGSARTLFEVDYLLRVNDVARAGALRLKETEGGPFLADAYPPIPPLIRVGELLSASDRVQEDEEDIEALRILLAPGSSLGGARPKASVLEPDGALSIAKFPAATDEWPVVIWEMVACTLAEQAGIRTQAARLEWVGDRPVLVTRRFDRKGDVRVPYLSGMAMIGEADGEEGHSYLHLADAIRQHGGRVAQDLEELWRRMVFNVLVSNTDDHLRNHGFLREDGGWTLSPAFDLNPVPVDVKPRIHALALDDSSFDASLDTLLEVADYFGLEHKRARDVAGGVATAVGRWRAVARELGLGAGHIARMASAFEHRDRDGAAKLVG